MFVCSHTSVMVSVQSCISMGISISMIISISIDIGMTMSNQHQNQLYLKVHLNFVGVDDGVANGASNVPLVGVGDVLALLHRHRDAVRVANLLQKSPLLASWPFHM